ncbi:MAG: hypothetical protein Q4C05_05440 [Akkermansia sp.]|nr:hypothetical protein [Akkermansia sp.]
MIVSPDDFRTLIIPHYSKLKPFKLLSPKSLLYADLWNATQNYLKSVIIISKKIILIAYEAEISTHDNSYINVIKVEYVNSSLTDLQPLINTYISNPNNSIQFVYYSRNNKIHLVPLNRFLIHSTSPRA